MFRKKKQVIITLTPDGLEIKDIVGKNITKDEAQSACSAAAHILGCGKVKRKKRNA